MKRCASCKKEKASPLFGRDKTRADGLNVYCKECFAEKGRKYKEANRAKRRATVNAYDKRAAAKIKRWREENADALRAYWADYGKKYRTEKRAETQAKTRRQQAARRRAVPPWIDRAAEVAVYAEAERRRKAGEPVEVDHIVPLQGENFCGLHWHGNLRVLDARLNRSRANALDPNEHPLAFAREGMSVRELLGLPAHP